jgi:hypothetical protein
MIKLLFLYCLICVVLGAAPTEPVITDADRIKCLGIIASIVCFAIVVGIVVGVLKAKDALG